MLGLGWTRAREKISKVGPKDNFCQIFPKYQIVIIYTKDVPIL
jgi:hypothetical protein